MKIVGIGDLFIPSSAIAKGFAVWKEDGAAIETADWTQNSYEELQRINLLVETSGSEAYDVPKHIVEAVKDADIIVTQFCPITKKVIDACPKLRRIGVLRAGYENVNVEYASQKRIAVYNTPGRNATAVADFTVGMLLSECRNIAKSHKNLKKGRWVRDYANAGAVPDLSGKTVGIIGLGQVGQKVAKRLRAFEMELLGYDPYVKEAPPYIKLVTLPELARCSDFITIHTRLCKETERMIGADFLRMAKPGAYFINTARSGMVDEAALYEALRSGALAGAALDVFDAEPPPRDYPLLSLDNVTVTPHLAGGTVDAFMNSPVLLAKYMREALNGQTNSHCVVNKS